MNQVVTTGIILHRLNYGEADRILTVITPDHGKLRLMAKGVRKVKSKLAGGIELFSISTLTYIPGRRDIHTLISTRLVTHYGNIVAKIDRTMMGYELLKKLDKATQDECEEEFYHLLVYVLSSLNHLDIPVDLIEVWFYVQLLKLLGHEPNLTTDAKGEKLEEGHKYLFDFEHMAFIETNTGKFRDTHIKVMRLLLSQKPEKLTQISGIEKLTKELQPLLAQLQRQFA